MIINKTKRTTIPIRIATKKTQPFLKESPKFFPPIKAPTAKITKKRIMNSKVYFI